MSHECGLRSTPSSAFRNHGVGNVRSLGTDKYREYCCDIRQSGQYLLEVINDILDMSKIEAGRIRLDAKQIELEPFLNDAMRVVSARADDKRLSLIARIRAA